MSHANICSHETPNGTERKIQPRQPRDEHRNSIMWPSRRVSQSPWSADAPRELVTASPADYSFSNQSCGL